MHAPSPAAIPPRKRDQPDAVVEAGGGAGGNGAPDDAAAREIFARSSISKRPVVQSDGITLAFHRETATRLN